MRFAGFAVAHGPLLGIIMAGATIESLMGGLAGMNSGNSRLRQFEQAIEQGEILVLVDISRDQIETIRKLVVKHHPESEFEGIEPLLPPSY